MSEGLKYTAYPLPAALMVEHQLSDEIIDTLNDYLDKLTKDKERESHGGLLVGQISEGEQLTMDWKAPELKEFAYIVHVLAVNYIQSFVKMTGVQVPPKTVEINDLSSVHSYAGDYNPIHDHGMKTIMGISFTTWTKVPEQIGRLGEGENQNEEFTLHESSGAIDGFLTFTYGLNQLLDSDRLRPSQSRTVCPKVGRLLMFPCWLQHAVYPFKGEGERRTVAGNVNCWDIKEEGEDNGV